MAIRRELLLILLLLLVIAVLVKLIEFFQVNIVEADASKFVSEDLRNKYPSADISIMTITQKTNDDGARYLEVKARVTQDPESPCPERSHIFYNYPKQNFVPQQPEVITKNCVVCASGLCTIAFPEEAIIASHTFPGTSDVQAYLNRNPNAQPSAVEKADSWEVTWVSDTAISSYVVTIHRDGTILGIKQVPKA
ncbi:MAG: hypothetical protein U0R44_03370 [Candidatus Micrarchaeia archaeon]